MPKPSPSPRRITFLTGTRAEFGLMASTLHAIQSHPKLSLSLLATGSHLDPAHGSTLNEILHQGFQVDATISWPPSTPATSNQQPATNLAINTAHATAAIATQLQKLKTDILLVVGDRVEAFAGATAAHLSHIPVAHVHGGDRALGQIDDSLRHAITKLSHIHFPATQQSAARIKKLGEDPAHIHLVGSPGLDNIAKLATPRKQITRIYNVRPKNFALLLYHPTTPDPALEQHRARLLLDVALDQFDRLVIVYPNNDPGSAGILKVWHELERANLHRVTLLKNAPRPDFLGLMRDTSLLLGNSSSGIIEAASFSTPVLDVGPRQLGRERSANVLHADYHPATLSRLIKSAKSRRPHVTNVYGKGKTAQQIAQVLATKRIDSGLLQKLITY